MCRPWRALVVLAAVMLTAAGLGAQTAPAFPMTPGERLSGGSVVLAEATRGQTAVLVASFSRDSSTAATDWLRALHSDPDFAAAVPYQVVMLARAPGFVRSMIRSAMRRQTPPAWQATTVILTADEPQWRAWFGASNDREPWIVVLSPGGRILWRGHGNYAASAEALKAALR